MPVKIPTAVAFYFVSSRPRRLVTFLQMLWLCWTWMELMWPGGNDSNICTMTILEIELCLSCRSRAAEKNLQRGSLSQARTSVVSLGHGCLKSVCRFACGNIKGYGILGKRESDWDLPPALEILQAVCTTRHCLCNPNHLPSGSNQSALRVTPSCFEHA